MKILMNRIRLPGFRLSGYSSINLDAAPPGASKG
jgi:hypothetical protein